MSTGTTGRWNALQPDRKAGKGDFRSRGRRNNSQSFAYSTRKYNNSRDFRAKGDKTSFDERASLTSLASFLRLCERGLQEESIVSSGVMETLRSYEKFLLASNSRTADSEFLVILCKLLRVNDDVVRHTVERLIELLFEEGCKLHSFNEVSICTEELIKTCYQYPSDSNNARRLLAAIVCDSGQILPAEEFAQRVVAPLFLPVLESKNSNRMLFTKVCKAVSTLILNQSHKSAILAPLLNDISPEGGEEFVANPIRQRLFSALQDHLNEQNGRASWRDLACCYLLTDVVDSSIKIDRSLGPGVNTSISISRTKDFFLESLCVANQAICVAAMFLLRSLLRYELRLGNGSISQPMLDLLSRIIFYPANLQTPKLDYCYSLAEHGFSYGNLLSLVHVSWIGRSRNLESGKVAVACLSEIVMALPWDRWMRGENLMGAVSESGFGRRTVNFLRGLNNVALCAISSCDEKSITTTRYLVESYFHATKVEHRELFRFSTTLWSTIAESSLSHPSERVRQELVSLLVESCGGQIMPDGKTTTIYGPARRWLLSQSSEPFLDSLFIKVGELQSCPSHPSITLLSSILQSVPQIASSNSWNRCNILFSSVDDINVKIGCIVILDAVICGRRKYGDNSSSIEPIKGVILTILSTALNSSSVKIQCLGLSLFGSLMAIDWQQMDLENEGVGLLLRLALNLCKGENPNVRSSACKSIGNFCTQYIQYVSCRNSVADIHIRSEVDMICRCMNLALLDEKPQVRSMAMFAIGNIAHALRTSFEASFQSSALVDSCKMAQAAMKDSSDKVVVNSVRAVGHLGYLLAREQVEEETEMLSCLISELLKVLTASGESLSKETDSLTWKKRGLMMKYGCGVCHSLGCIFGGIFSLRGAILQMACAKAVHQLVICIEQSWSLSLKLAFSAMAALGNFSRNNLSQICEGSGILGAAIATCTYRLSENSNCMSIRTLSTQQAHQTEACLIHLLAAASRLDASAALEKDYFCEVTLSFLYSWMVKNDLDGSAFAIFALSLRRFELKYADVSLEQSFISRSLDTKTTEVAPINPNVDDGSEL